MASTAMLGRSVGRSGPSLRGWTFTRVILFHPLHGAVSNLVHVDALWPGGLREITTCDRHSASVEGKRENAKAKYDPDGRMSGWTTPDQPGGSACGHRAEAQGRLVRVALTAQMGVVLRRRSRGLAWIRSGRSSKSAAVSLRLSALAVPERADPVGFRESTRARA